MYYTTPIPLEVLTTITNTVQNTFPNFEIKQQQKLIDKLIELWVFIYISKKADDKYTNIPTSKFEQFNIQVSGIRLFYTDLLKVLSDIKLIIINDKYSTGKFSKSYKPYPGIDYTDYKMINLDFAKITKHTRSKEYWLEKYPEHSNIISSTYSSSIDLDGYFTHLEKNKGIYLSTSRDSKYITHKQYLNSDKIYEYKLAAIQYNLKNIWFKVSSTGRFYNSCATVSKMAVDYILINGNKTTNIDAKNSQPLLLSNFVDCPEFTKDVQQGTFYDKLAYLTGNTREDMKKIAFREIFFSNELINKKWSAILEIGYPTLAKQINDIKNEALKNIPVGVKHSVYFDDEKNDESTLWYKLQTMESAIWVETAKTFSFPVLLRHDQIICEEKYLKIVTKAITAKYKEFKLKPTLDIK